MSETDHIPKRAPSPPPAPGLGRNVKALGVVSLFTDISSEMVYPLTPLFLTIVLGSPAKIVGLIEGIAESAASLLKLYSGWISDRMGRRKPLALAGYSLSALSKPLIGIATLWAHVLGARLLDRVGKGLRTAPRDALIAESCPKEMRGRAFGLHRSMDTIGAVIGPLFGYLFLRRFSPDYLRQHTDLLRWLYALAFIPALLGVITLAVFVGEKRKPSAAENSADQAAEPDTGCAKRVPSWSSLSPAYRRYLLLIGLFSIGNSSDTFLILRAQGMGLDVTQTLLLYALYNVVEALLAYPAGYLSDRIGRKSLLVTGYVIFALVYLGFALLTGIWAVGVLFVLYGFYYTFTQGVQRAFATDLTHPDRRATEIGAFHMIVGLLALPASLLAGVLYDHHPTLPFLLGAVTAGSAALLLAVSKLDKRESQQLNFH
jgi:MFS family permease